MSNQDVEDKERKELEKELKRLNGLVRKYEIKERHTKDSQFQNHYDNVIWILKSHIKKIQSKIGDSQIKDRRILKKLREEISLSGNELKEAKMNLREFMEEKNKGEHYHYLLNEKKKKVEKLEVEYKKLKKSYKNRLEIIKAIDENAKIRIV